MAAVLEAYRSRDWTGAEAALKKLKGAGTLPGLEGVAAVYATRVADFRQNPPSDDWDGISQALEK
jgi:adenylate cyclase